MDYFSTLEQLHTFAEIRAVYHPKRPAEELQKITCSLDVARYLRPIFADFINHREGSAAVFLNRTGRVIGWAMISLGGVSSTTVDPKLIFQLALSVNASSLFIAHNHPSGSLRPSEADLSLTKKLVDGGKLIEIKVIDHVILTEDNYFSFADDGLI